MSLNLDSIEEVYGQNTLLIIKDNIDTFKNNINYLESIGFYSIYDLVELYPYSFIQNEEIFCEKVNNLVNKLGVECVEKIMNNTELWGEVDE